MKPETLESVESEDESVEEDECCCGWLDLRSGTIAIGVARVAVALTVITLLYRPIVSLTAGPRFLTESWWPEAPQDGYLAAVFISCVVVTLVLSLPLDVLLICGGERQSRRLLRVWLLLGGGLTGVGAACALLAVLAAYNCRSAKVILLSYGSLVGMAVACAWWRVVLGFYRRLGRAADLAFRSMLDPADDAWSAAPPDWLAEKTPLLEDG